MHRKQLNKWGAWVALLCLAGTLFLAGCASGSRSAAGPDPMYTLMTTQRTAFLTQGPAQQTPDSYLDPGTRIRVLDASGGMMHVQTVDGHAGWVASSDIGPPQERPARSQ